MDKPPSNVLVVGLDPATRRRLENLRCASGIRFHPLLDHELLSGHDGYDIRAILHAAEVALSTFPGRVDGIVAYRDFPESTIVPLLAQRFRLPSPSLEAVLRCEHKYWSRCEQQAVIPDHVPVFRRFDPFASPEESLARIDLPLPFWMKPVKSFASHLGFRVGSEQDFRRAITRTRRDIRRLATPFDDVVALADVPLDVARPGQVSCLAEQMVGGRQCTVEGCVVGGEMMVFGVVDSLRAENGSTFLRYQYPSALPDHVRQRMVALCEKVVRRIGLDSGCFNAELFWDEARDHVWFLEINPRIALHHAELYERVDGLSSYEMAVEVALGRRPVLARGAGSHRVAATCFLRAYADAVVTRVPSAEQIAAIERDVPGTLIDLVVERGTRLSELIEQEPYSYTLGLVHVAGDDEAEIQAKYDRVVERLGIGLAAPDDRTGARARVPALPLAAPPRTPRAGRADERLAAWRASRSESERSRATARAPARASARPSPERSSGRRTG